MFEFLLIASLIVLGASWLGILVLPGIINTVAVLIVIMVVSRHAADWLKKPNVEKGRELRRGMEGIRDGLYEVSEGAGWTERPYGLSDDEWKAIQQARQQGSQSSADNTTRNQG